MIIINTGDHNSMIYKCISLLQYLIYEITQSLLPILSLPNLDEADENERDCCPSCPETSWEFSDESVTLELKYYIYTFV